MIHASDRSLVATCIAAFLSTFILTPLTQDRTYLATSWLLIGLLGGLTVVLRRLRLAYGLVLVAQVLLGYGYLGLLSVGVPGPWWGHFGRLYAAAVEHMQTQAAPMEPNAGVTFVFVTAAGVVTVVTDLLVSGLRRPAWGIAAPAAMFAIPAIGLDHDSGLWAFLCLALGYLAILVAEGLNLTARWPRGLSYDSARAQGTAAPVVWRAVGYLGAPALVGAVVMAMVLPTISLSGFGFGNGSGGNGPLQLRDPSLDLRRNLTLPENRTVITYTTNESSGTYLRMASLPRLSSAGFSNVQMNLQSGKTLGPIPGVALEPGSDRETHISVLDFDSQFLPLPYAARSFSASGSKWGFDPASLITVSTDRSRGISGMTYSVVSADVEPTNDAFLSASAGTPVDSAETGIVPADLPPVLREVAARVTADAGTAVEKAIAIQDYLRGPTFTYSVDPGPQDGDGYSALENFLLKDHKGYCEQFAGAMAMMARVAGIPSRVAVGFLPGQKNPSTNVYQVSSHDMHAWPELYFANYGWVRFEPTPAIQTGSEPPWTVDTTKTTGSNPTSKPSSAVPSSTASAKVGPRDPVGSQGPLSHPAAPGFPWGRTLAGTGIGLLALLVLAAPATIRIRRRTSRLTDSGAPAERVEAAWSEIRDTVVDLGGTWPEGSPRGIGHQVAGRLEEGESEAMSGVATLVERSRYSRSLEDSAAVQELPEVTDRIRKGLAAPRRPGTRLRAFLLPRSVLRRRVP